MTPKEKAIELVNKFKTYADDNYADDKNPYYGQVLANKRIVLNNSAKQCALIAVNEIIKDRNIATFDKEGNPVIDKQGRQIFKEKRGGNIAEQYDEWLKAMFYGIKEKDLGKIFWGKVDVAKSLRKLGRYTSLNMLGFNFVQGVSNVIMGETMQWVESAGGQFYNPKNYVKAKVFYHLHLGAVLGDVGRRDPKSLLGKFAEEFDFLNEYDDGKFRGNSKLRNLMHSGSAYFVSHAGEHFMQVSSSLAMLDHMPAMSGDKELGSLLDCMKLDDKGELTFIGPNGEKVTNFDKDQRKIFEGKLRRKLSMMHGEYTPAGRVAAQNHAAMNLVLMFRKFIIPGIRRRWGKSRYNNILQEEVKGDYLHTLNFFKRLLIDYKAIHFDLMKSDWNNLLDSEKAAIRRSAAEFALMGASIILASFLINMQGEDDDDSWFLDFFAYQAARYKAEMWFFLNPLATMQILRSPAASMSMIENTIKLFGQALMPPWTGYDLYERGPRKGQMKIRKTASNLIPGPKQVYRVMYPEELISMFK